MHLGIVGLQLQCPAVAGNGFVQLPLLLQCIAEVAVRLGIVRLQLQCPVVAGQGFGNPAQGAIRFPQVVVKRSRIPVQLDRPSNVLDGHLVLADLVGNHAEKMNRVGLIRLGLQNLPIDPLGSLQPAGLMVPDRNRQRLGNRCHQEIREDRWPRSLRPARRAPAARPWP
jgi:hypothetical protein